MARQPSDTTVMKKRIKELEEQVNLLTKKNEELNKIADSAFARQRDAQEELDFFVKRVDEDMKYMAQILDTYTKTMNRVMKRGDK